MTKRNCFALFIGINKYNAPATSLSGCVYDVQKIQTYLKTRAAFKHHHKTLLDEAATKTGVVTTFEEHLIANAKTAKAEDVFLLYFSGHGCQEYADEVWTSDYNGKLECLVCYNEENELEQHLLADKELRYLIHKLYTANPKIHILTIFDCCHAGDNTRTAIFEAEGAKQVSVRRVAQVAKQRAWEDFIFHKAIPYGRIKKAGVHIALPEGKHIQLAACQQNESAWEVSRADSNKTEGVFTKNLLEVLARSEHKITYYDLKRRIRNYLRLQYPQTPQLYVQGQGNEDIFRFFLGKSDEIGESKRLSGHIYQKAQAWVLDMGSVHGVTLADEVHIQSLDGKQAFSANIKAVHLSETILDFPAGVATQAYKGYVENSLQHQLHIFIQDEEDMPNVVEAVKTAMQAFPYLQIASNRSLADYELRLQAGEFAILSKYSHPENETDHLAAARQARLQEVPLVATIPYAQISLLMAYLEQISRWEYIRQFSNAKVRLFEQKPPVKIHLSYKNEADITINAPLDKNTFTVPLLKTEGAWENRIQIKIINIHNQPIYCSLLYLNNRFGVYDLLPSTESFDNNNPSIISHKYIEPQRTLAACEGQAIPIGLEAVTRQHCLPEEVHYLKLIVATEAYKKVIEQSESFHIAALPAFGERPTLPPRRGFRAQQRHDWTAFTIRLVIPNPEWEVAEIVE